MNKNDPNGLVPQFTSDVFILNVDYDCTNYSFDSMITSQTIKVN
jgi:hypothetical protein